MKRNAQTTTSAMMMTKMWAEGWASRAAGEARGVSERYRGAEEEAASRSRRGDEHVARVRARQRSRAPGRWAGRLVGGKSDPTPARIHLGALPGSRIGEGFAEDREARRPP